MLIVATAWFVINNTQQTILESYRNFGNMLAQTFSIEASEFIVNYNDKASRDKFISHVENIVTNSEDIASISYMDAAGKVLYSSDLAGFSAADNTSRSIRVSLPLTIENAHGKQVVGSIQLGLTGHTMNIVGKATRNLMIVVFTIAWMLSIAAVFINTMLIIRQIKLLSEGVKKILQANLGYLK